MGCHYKTRNLKGKTQTFTHIGGRGTRRDGEREREREHLFI